MATTNHGKHQMQQIAELHLYKLQASGRHLPTAPEHPHGHEIGLSPVCLFIGYWINPAHHHAKITPGDMLQLGAFYFHPSHKHNAELVA
jgi:hypothetical protein